MKLKISLFEFEIDWVSMRARLKRWQKTETLATSVNILCSDIVLKLLFNPYHVVLKCN